MISGLNGITNFEILEPQQTTEVKLVQATQGEDFVRWNDWLFLGNAIAAHDDTFIKEVNITHVVNCALGDCPFSPIENISYHNLSLEDNWIQSIFPFLDEAVKFIKEAHEAGGNVLVHCQQGVSRSVSVLTAYLVAEEKMNLAKAKTEIQRIWPKADPNPIFKEDLIRYQEQQSISSAVSCATVSICLEEFFSSNGHMDWSEYKNEALTPLKGRETGYTEKGRWGRGAAGVMVVSQAEEGNLFVLLLCRSEEVEESNVWSIPGGARQETEEGDLEDPLRTALHELREEAGLPAHGRLCKVPIVDESVDYSYHTYILDLTYDKEAYTPRLNWENAQYRWFTPVEILEGDWQVHPGVKFVMEELKEFSKR